MGFGKALAGLVLSESARANVLTGRKSSYGRLHVSKAGASGKRPWLRRASPLDDRQHRFAAVMGLVCPDHNPSPSSMTPKR